MQVYGSTEILHHVQHYYRAKYERFITIAAYSGLLLQSVYIAGCELATVEFSQANFPSCNQFNKSDISDKSDKQL